MSLSKFMYVKKPSYNSFNLSHSNCLTGNMGKLLPILATEVYPGDIFNLKSTVFIRTKPMITAPFQNIRCTQRYFYVPLRFLMNHDDFEEYISGGKNLEATISRPTINSGENGFAAGSLMDLLGYASNYLDDNLNAVVVANKTSLAWRLRAYAKVIRDHYLNHDVEDEDTICPISFEAGADTTTNTNIISAQWSQDYFNENLPFSGRGEPTTIGIGDYAPVQGTGISLGITDGTNNGGLIASNLPNAANYNFCLTAGSGAYGENVGGDNPSPSLANKIVGITTDASKSGMRADLRAAVDVDVDELKTLFGMDNYKKLSARVGATYKDFLLGMWGEHSNDLRIDRSHYLGGRISPIMLEEVEQTSATSETSPQGNLTARGASVNGGQIFNYKFDDYGILLGILCVMPDGKYFQGQDRALDYEDWLDYPNPRLSLLGDQATYVGELFTQGDDSTTTVGTTDVGNKTIFGFNPKYEEVRCIQSRVHGQYKTVQKYATQVREFAEPPLLNSSYLRGNPSKRIFAVLDQEYDSLDIEVGFQIFAKRRFPKYGNPATMGLMY